MAVLIFVGWLLGLGLGVLGSLVLLLSFGLSVPASLAGPAGMLAPLLAALPTWLVFIIVVILFIGPHLLGYAVATAGIAPLLPGATGVPTLSFPLAAPQATPAGVGVTIGPSAGEFFGRGLLIGLTAATDTVFLSMVPLAGPVLASWAFTVVSLAGIVFVARNRIFQGFLGWSAWLLPLSWLATGPGLILFIVNIPFALIAFGLAAFRIDWTTGVIETHGGVSGINLTGVPGAAVSFSLGNFTFLSPMRPQLSFTAADRDSHETGHSLNTAALGGVVLWINAVDQTIFPRRFNLAYGELTAEGHANNFGTIANDFSLRLWF